MQEIKFLNTKISNTRMQPLLEMIQQRIDHKLKTYVVAVNIDVLVKAEKDNYLKEIIDNADVVLADGQPLLWISKLYKTPIKEKLSGSDLVPLLLKLSADRGYRVYILGGQEGVAQKAKEHIESHLPDICICGVYAPPFGFERDPVELDQICIRINNASPDLLITCFGCPKQEKFIFEQYHQYNATVSICAGATVDFLAGSVKRAPKWMSDSGLEWIYRFCKEPRRLFKRYFIEDMKIIPMIWKYRKDMVLYKGAYHENTD